MTRFRPASPLDSHSEVQRAALGLSRIDEIAHELQIGRNRRGHQVRLTRRAQHAADKVHRHRLALGDERALHLQRLGHVPTARIGRMVVAAQGPRRHCTGRTCLRILRVQPQQQRGQLQRPLPVADAACRSPRRWPPCALIDAAGQSARVRAASSFRDRGLMS